MKFVSHAALIAVLATGMSAAIVATPAAAQKKGKKDEGAGAKQLKLSEEFRKAYVPAEQAIAAKNYAAAAPALDAAEAVAKTDDEKYIVTAQRLQIAAQGGGNNEQMLPLLSALIANPSTPATDLPRYNYFRGALPYQQKKYADALPYLMKARELGYQDQNLSLQIAQANVETGNVAGGMAEMEKAITAEEAAGRKAPQEWYNYAIGRTFTAGQKGETAKWLQKSVKAYPTAENWRKVILVYRDAHEAKGAKALDNGQKMDLYRLMRATKALADRGDYIEYADLAYRAGLPYETKAVIEEGRATGKIPAGDKIGTELLTLAGQAIAKDTPLATLEKQAGTAATGKPAMSTADVYLAQGQFAKAVPLYRTALQKGGVDTSEANLRLGQALVQSGDAAGARTALAAVTTAPRSDIAGFWTNWLELSPTMTGGDN